MHMAKKKIKKIVSYAKFKVHDDLYNELGIREWEKFSSSQEYGKEKLGFRSCRCIKSDNKNVLVKDNNTKECEENI